MTANERVQQARRIARAWAMVLRSAESGNAQAKEQWLTEWQRLCNELIATIEVPSGEWSL